MYINFLLFFYTDVFGIPAAVAGTMFMLTRFWDAVNDPIMGIIADRTNTKHGKFRPYLLWMMFPMAVIGVLMFTTPNLSVGGKIIYAYVTYILMMMAYTAINIPYSALMGVLSPSSAERTSASTYRFVLAFAGAFIIQGATLPLVNYFGKGDQAIGFPITMGIFGLLAMGMFFITFKTTKERVQPSPKQKTSLKNDLKDLMGNKPWMILLVMGIFTLGYVIIRMGTIMYYFKYYLGNELLAGTFMMAGTVAVIAGTACTQYLSKLLGKKKLYLIAMGLSTILTMVFFYIPKDQIVMIFAVHILISLVMAPQAPLIWAMYADTADYSEWKNGRRATGLVFSAATFSQKFGMAIGGGLAGWLLSIFNFEPNTVQSPETITGIKLMMSYIPAGATVVAVIAALFYPLDDKTMENIEKDLQERNARKKITSFLLCFVCKFLNWKKNEKIYIHFNIMSDDFNIM